MSLSQMQVFLRPVVEMMRQCLVLGCSTAYGVFKCLFFPFISVLPAHASVQNCTGHNGKEGCPYCRRVKDACKSTSSTGEAGGSGPARYFRPCPTVFSLARTVSATWLSSGPMIRFLMMHLWLLPLASQVCMGSRVQRFFQTFYSLMSFVPVQMTAFTTGFRGW